jgi:hypothetical protein
MTLPWLILLGSALALLVPMPAFYSRKHSYRDLHQLEIERRNGSRWGMVKQLLRFSGHWIDLARGLLGSIGVLMTIDQLATISPLYARHAAWADSVVPLTLATLCVMMIAFFFHYPGKSLAPIPFVAGTLLVLVPPSVAFLALLLGLFFAAKLRALSLFFILLAPALALLGFFLDRLLWPSLAGAVLAATPIVLAFFRHRDLVIPVRRPRSS